jgi:hypothetical protein
MLDRCLGPPEATAARAIARRGGQQRRTQPIGTLGKHQLAIPREDIDADFGPKVLGDDRADAVADDIPEPCPMANPIR